MNEREYIRVLKILYDGANEYTIKVWSTEPSYSNIQRTIYDREDAIEKCKKINRLDLLRIIEKGI